jgi:hypothetical protein
MYLKNLFFRDVPICKNYLHIGYLHALQNLHLGGCLKLQKLPTSIGQLIVLQKLNLSKWFNLQKLL